VGASDFVTLSASEKYLAIWHDNLIGDWVAHHNLTSSGYQSKFDQLTSSGFYPICVQAGGEGSGVRFAAIFAKNETPISRKWTVTGKEVPSLSGFDDYVKSLMQKHNVRAGSLASLRIASWYLLARIRGQSRIPDYSTDKSFPNCQLQ
jgi:hypothetical protein